MRKEKMVTRTFTLTTGVAMAVDITTSFVTNITFEVIGELTGDKLLNEVKKSYESDTIKVVAVTSSSTTETLFGMTESDFVKYAVVLPTR